MKRKVYWSWRWWIRWFIPIPLMLWYSKKYMGSHVWYQDEECQLELRHRSDEKAGVH